MNPNQYVTVKLNLDAAAVFLRTILNEEPPFGHSEKYPYLRLAFQNVSNALRDIVSASNYLSKAAEEEELNLDVLIEQANEIRF